ncbi:MAG: 1-deoxy-D-xylulose-5-phosphate reductoisomerase [Clostridiales bacterium]|nr:1-deoxy-D-xylulose-5-phosphate reductoisomerase [Clostridiales bacterium]
MKNIAILGSTGSIGTQTLDVVRRNGDIRVLGVSAGRNTEKLEAQVREFHPRLAAVGDEAAARDFAVRIRDTDTRVVGGMDGLLALAGMEGPEILVTAIVGMIGIRPTMEAIRTGKDIALANKETLVTAGHLIMPLARECGVQILPVDSEHSAIFQAIHGEPRGSDSMYTTANQRQVHKLLITASGGPFRGRKKEDLAHVTVEDTLKHPNWVMGQKITVDSATLVNKGLEVMEARWLFGMDLEHIQVVVQPQSIIHSMVEFEDGAILAQLGTPDMRLPIQYALYYPERRYLEGERLDFGSLKQITFEEPDMETFLGLPMAIEASRMGGTMPTVFNAANEAAVKKFLQKKIGFLDIYEIIGGAMERHRVKEEPDLSEILAVERETHQWIESRW